ncbi:hypothetical protein V6N11_024937 [Hibiscus sabdariffa]|uniref:RNase H type-1 domain-containing protein n=1 Tax=Hibiscus sabdariffa TaxID=183260 RepID=A0ABR2QNL6_9ROSI
MSDILKMMANLRFTEKEIEEIDMLHFEGEHQVEGSESWLAGKVLTPIHIDHELFIRVFRVVWKEFPLEDTSIEDVQGDFQYGDWLKVDSGKPKNVGVQSLKPGVVLTKRDVVDVATSSTTGVIISRSSQAIVVNGDNGKGSRVEGTKGRSYKRCYGRKDTEGSLAIKKARSEMGVNANVVDDGPEDTPPQKAIVSECKHVQDVFIADGIAASLPISPFSNCHELILEVVSLLDREALTHFGTLLWSIWNRRNKWVHDGKLTPARIVVVDVRTLLVDMAAACSTSAHHPPYTRSLTWAAPNDGTVKVNVDVAFCPDTGIAAIGVIARDSHRLVIDAYASTLLGVHTAETAQACAFAKGIELVVANNWPNAIVEGDSSFVVARLRSTDHDFSTIASHLTSARATLANNSGIWIHYAAKDQEIRVRQRFYESKKSYTGMHMYKEAYQCLHILVTAAKTVIVFSITSGANVSFFLNACLWAFSGSFMETKQKVRTKRFHTTAPDIKYQSALSYTKYEGSVRLAMTQFPNVQLHGLIKLIYLNRRGPYNTSRRTFTQHIAN